MPRYVSTCSVGTCFSPAKPGTSRCEEHKLPSRRSARDRNGNWSKIRAKVLRRDDWTCRACGHKDTTGRTIQIDHIWAVKDGGRDDLDNLRCLCVSCHRDVTNAQGRGGR
jgi:5-methylcytosine-specific restriction protein A